MLHERIHQFRGNTKIGGGLGEEVRQSFGIEHTVLAGRSDRPNAIGLNQAGRNRRGSGRLGWGS